jgi:hypothetical protein
MTKNDNELRDFFAANAMNRLIEGYETIDIPYQKKNIAKCSYEMADEMMEARKEKKQND